MLSPPLPQVLPTLRTRWPWWLGASIAFGAGVFVAAHHPVWHGLAVVVFVVWTLAAARVDGLWLFVLPAVLPAMDFAPWTGWIVVDEFDLVVVGALAGGYMRLGLQPPQAPAPARQSVLLLLCAAAIALSLARGLLAAGPPAWDWYQDETGPLNAVRIAKAAVAALLLWPLLRHEVSQSATRTLARLGAGMLAGSAIVVAAVLWERASHPGLFDFAAPYRTVAMFWEMHLGGAAIDAYLAMAVPFVAWAVATAPTPVRWLLAAALALLMEYACLTSFSRGVYLAAAVSLIVSWLLSRGRLAAPPWRRRAAIGLVAVLLFEAAAVLGSDSYMLARMRHSTQDFGSRLAHWQHGVELLHGPLDWAFGKGLGRLPAAYSAAVAEHELSGSAQVVTRDGERFLRLQGPRRIEALAGLHALTQRIPFAQTGAYRTSFDARVERAVQINLSVCEIHLLYEERCQHGFKRLSPDGTRWRHTELVLDGPPPADGRRPPRMKVFALSVLDAGAVVELDNLVLRDTGSANLLRNADFSDRLARWFPAAQHYFVPWHIDNLTLELLIEQGMVGLAIFASLFASAAAGLLSARRRGLAASAWVLAALAGAWTVGLVSSVLDVPRVAFLMLLLSVLALTLAEARPASERG
ncbi:MAG TPA: hypothetical protein VF169_05625 [Albitalea sp.]|uniref:O-antigen ligase family protein n=1 Tax=Piscinibacter sp. TaxID=1903157 RepID=UPI002ED1A6C8